MGYAHKQYIEQAGEWLLAKLQYQNPIRYSQLYNPNTDLDETGRSLGIHDGFATMIDLAVLQLSDQRILSRRELPDEPLLMDDSIDYEIFFNWQKLDPRPHYVGVDL